MSAADEFDGVVVGAVVVGAVVVGAGLAAARAGQLAPGGRAEVPAARDHADRDRPTSGPVSPASRARTRRRHGRRRRRHTTVFMPCIGGVGVYRQLCDQVAAEGYEAFTQAG